MTQTLLSDVTSREEAGIGLLFSHFDEMLLVAEKLRTGDGDASESSAQSELNEQRDRGRMSLGKQDGT